MATRNERIAEIEILFRAGNERMAGWPENQERAQRGETLRVFCECARLSCRRYIPVTAEQYEAVRADPMLFVVAPGHEFPEAEQVIAPREGHVVVRKNEDVRALVERMDLRSTEDP